MIEPYPCPRCGERTLQEFYAPCEDCRTELKENAFTLAAWRAFTDWWTGYTPDDEWKHRLGKTDD